jgi:6-pyruvoyltetrahydropterin/6-carboxytetrahydropterin synthase
MYTLKVQEHFDAAHHVEGYDGKCARVHGHRWIIEVEVRAEELDEVGMVCDFGELRKMLRSILPDHLDVNQVYTDMNPTAENLARVFCEQMKARVAETVAVTVWESPDCSCRYELVPESGACKAGLDRGGGPG